MVRSKICSLNKNKKSEEAVEFGECFYDLGGYFIIRGSEKVIVAQERMAFNFVQVFKNKTPDIPWICEVFYFIFFFFIFHFSFYFYFFFKKNQELEFIYNLIMKFYIIFIIYYDDL